MKINETFTGSKVPKGTKFLYPAGTIFRDSAYTLVSLFFLTYIQFCAPLGYSWSLADGRIDTLYTSQMLVISAIIVVLRIWDGFNDPIMGWIVEKVHFKMGKYKPWILIGGLTNAVVLYLMFTLRPVGWGYVIFFGIFYLLWDFTFTMNDIGYWSMLPSLSSDEKERNSITTLVSVCASIGAFAAGGIIPQLVSGNAVQMYSLIALVIAILFGGSQVILFFFCKEHKRDPNQEKISESTKFTDMFRILKKNDQTRIATIVILIYYLGSCILNGFGLNYFYFTYGYGSGGTIQFYFTVAYAAGTIIAQCIFPLLLKKFSRNKLFTISFIVLSLGYILFFFYNLPIGDFTLGLKGISYFGDIAILCVLGVFIFAGQGLFYLILLVMMTNTIEYNEFKFGERRESVIFSLRPLTAKISNALMSGIVAVGLSVTSLYAISSRISDLEVQKGLEEITKEDVISGADSLIDGIAWDQMFWLKFFMCILPLILFIISYILIKKFYIIDEKYYENMTKVIAEKESKEAK
ncbi:MAG: glycoside-pentoside-hexuronide (GPH):cation symporter [Bacilli bacterium]